MIEIDLPINGWKLRPYQKALWRYLTRGGKRAFACWHRRAGKDDIALHWCARSMHERVCNTWYALPEFAQGRKAIWTAINSHTGRRRIDEAFPHELRASTSDNEMFIRFLNGSTFQVVGSDQYDRQVGSSVAGVVFSEWALANPSAWAYLRPILEENDGWALFVTTPRGRNHAYEMYKHAEKSPDWFCETLTARATGALTEQQLAEALKEYRALYGEPGEALWKQEYQCDWASGLLGAIFSYEMAEVRAEGRITEIEPIAGPVHRSWDLGMRDDTCVWFWQAVGSQVFLYDCISTSGASLDWWRDKIEEIHAARGWRSGNDYVPHDAKVRELSTGRTRVETMRSLGLSPMLAPDASLQDGINAVRRTLPLCVFHPRCEDKGIAALEQYQREWDSEKKCFRASPLHDWCSDPVDSFRYLALSWKPAPLREIKVPAPTGWRIPPPDDRPRQGIRL